MLHITHLHTHITHNTPAHTPHTHITCNIHITRNTCTHITHTLHITHTCTHTHYTSHMLHITHLHTHHTHITCNTHLYTHITPHTPAHTLHITHIADNTPAYTPHTYITHNTHYTSHTCTHTHTHAHTLPLVCICKALGNLRDPPVTRPQEKGPQLWPECFPDNRLLVWGSRPAHEQSQLQLCKQVRKRSPPASF